MGLLPSGWHPFRFPPAWSWRAKENQSSAWSGRTSGSRSGFSADQIQIQIQIDSPKIHRKENHLLCHSWPKRKFIIAISFQNHFYQFSLQCTSQIFFLDLWKNCFKIIFSFEQKLSDCKLNVVVFTKNNESSLNLLISPFTELVLQNQLNLIRRGSNTRIRLSKMFDLYRSNSLKNSVLLKWYQ